MVDFTLSPSQRAQQAAARAYAQSELTKAAGLIASATTPKARYQAIQPLVATAVAGGFVAASLPTSVGGGGGTLLDAAIAVEELYAVDSSVAVAFLGAGLGLAPILGGGTPEQQKEYCAKFVTKTGTPTAALGFTEATSGGANYVHNPELTTAVLDTDTNEYVIDGSKHWASNSAGFDYGGADIVSLVCRVVQPGCTKESTAAAGEGISIIVVTREDIDANPADAFTAKDEVDTIGFTATSGPHITFNRLRVPSRRLIGKVGGGIELVSGAFAGSAALVGAMSVGIMRTAFESALSFCRTSTRGGSHPIIEYQSVADLLIRMKSSLETSRLLTWKACVNFDSSKHADREGCWLAKVYCSEVAGDVVRDAMAAVGMESYAERMPFGRLMRDAACLPIFDGGNVGVRRRELQRLMMGSLYESRGMAFGEGA